MVQVWIFYRLLLDVAQQDVAVVGLRFLARVINVSGYFETDEKLAALRLAVNHPAVETGASPVDAGEGIQGQFLTEDDAEPVRREVLQPAFQCDGWLPH